MKKKQERIPFKSQVFWMYIGKNHLFQINDLQLFPDLPLTFAQKKNSLLTYPSQS